MKLHGEYCEMCKKDTFFVRRLIDPTNGKCNTIVDVCTECNTTFNVKQNN